MTKTGFSFRFEREKTRVGEFEISGGRFVENSSKEISVKEFQFVLRKTLRALMYNPPLSTPSFYPVSTNNGYDRDACLWPSTLSN